MGKCTDRVFKKHSVKLKAASHNNASWCTDIVGFLEHSLSRGSLYYKRPVLQKVIPSLGGPFSHILYTKTSKTSTVLGVRT